MRLQCFETSFNALQSHRFASIITAVCCPGKWTKAVGDPHPAPRWPFLSQGSEVTAGLQLSVERLDLVTKVTAGITRIASAGGDRCIKLDTDFVALRGGGEGWEEGRGGVAHRSPAAAFNPIWRINNRT